MEMHQIRYFLAVARTLNFTRAAEECNVTQPSLTRAIQKLEEEFGDLLLYRERSLTHLTAMGRAVLPHLQQILEAAEIASTVAGSIGRTDTPPLSIGISDGLCPGGFDDLLASVQGVLPDLRLHLRGGPAGAVIDLAVQGDLDLVVVIRDAPLHERLETWPLLTQSYGFVTPALSALADCDQVSLGQIAHQPLIDCKDRASDAVRRAAARDGIVPRFRHSVDNYAHALRLIGLHLGGAVLPVMRVGGDLRRIAISDLDLHDHIVLGAVSGRKRSIAAEAFVRAARSRGVAAA